KFLFLPLDVERTERKPFRCAASARAQGEDNETHSLDRRDHRRSASEGDGVAGGRGSAGDRDEGLEVTAATYECEEDAHAMSFLALRVLSAAQRCRLAPAHRLPTAVLLDRKIIVENKKVSTILGLGSGVGCMGGLAGWVPSIDV